MHNRRMVAYFIDTMIIFLFASFCMCFLKESRKVQEIEANMDKISQEYAIGKVDKISYFMEQSRYEKKMAKYKSYEIIIDGVLVVIYFIFVPMVTKGVTLGKKVMKLKIVDYNMMKLFIRAFLVNGLGTSILTAISILMIPSNYYLTCVSIFLILQLLTLIIEYFMVKYRHDCLGLDDILSKSRVEVLK